MFNKPSEKINLNSPDPNSDIYISEGERFNKDFAAYDYNRRNLEHERKKEMYQNRKNILYERERKRWEKMDYEYLKAENKIMMNKERNLVGRKNNPGMAFNPLTLQYDNSVQGEILKRRDDESKFRALMRATNIDKHANAGYNIINGEERTIMENRMLKEIEPSVYKKNIDKINEINQRHNDNDNFYTKGPSYNQPKNQFQQMPQQNEYMNNNNEQNQEIPQMPPKGEFNNIPPEQKDYRRTPNNFDNRQMEMNAPPEEKNYNNIPNDKEYKRRTPHSNMPPNNYPRITPQSNMNDYKRMTPQNIPPKDYQRSIPQNNVPPNDYQKNTSQNNIPPNDYQRMTPQNNMPPNDYQRMTPQNNYDNVQDERQKRRTPYSENNYRRMTPSNHGYNQMQQDERYNQMVPDHYSEQDKYERRYQYQNPNMNHDFDRQYNYMGNQEVNNYEDYKNQDYYNGKQGYPSSQNYNPRDEGYNENRDPYARPDYYANNKQRSME